MQCGVKLFVLDSKRVLAPAPKVPGSDIKTHLKSRFCLQAIWKKRCAIYECVMHWPHECTPVEPGHTVETQHHTRSARCVCVCVCLRVHMCT